MVWTTDRPHRTMLGIHTHALVTPPFTIETQWSHAENDRSVDLNAPLPTQTAQQGRGLVVPPFLVSTNYFRPNVPLDEPHPTQTSGGQHALVVPPYLVDLRGENAPRETSDPLSTVCGSGNHHGVVVPFLTSYNSTSDGSAMTEPTPTQDTRDRHALVLAPFIVSYYTRLAGQQAAVSGLDAALPTVPGRATHYLAQPGETPAIEDCGFRMLQPHEIGAAMAFPSTYKVLGNQRERVKQYGNAVTPPVMDVLVRRCLDVLG
jgi:DNA (cytosine-5)-methyltransferase 1